MDEFYFPSKDGNTEIHTIEWKPDNTVKAVLQISHGMVEYILRYQEFAEYLTLRGFYVVGNDHLGHGKSIQSKEELGFFHEKDGNTCVLEDMHQLRCITQAKYPCLPYFMLGHSMGSTLLRQYMMQYGEGLSGIILSGSVANKPLSLLKTARNLCWIMGKNKGWHYRSKFIDDLALGAYNKVYKYPETRADWVTSDYDKLIEYVNDPLCSYVFTVNAYYHMFDGMMQLQNKEKKSKVPTSLPILIASGEEDPVGNYRAGILAIEQDYKALGIEDVQVLLYPGDRHEILNERNRYTVYQDLLDWMLKRL